MLLVSGRVNVVVLCQGWEIWRFVAVDGSKMWVSRRRPLFFLSEVI